MNIMFTNIPSYVYAITKGDIDDIEYLFINKYSELLDFYYCIKSFNDYVKNVEYEKDDNGFEILVMFEKIKVEDVYSSLKETIPSKKGIKLTKKKNGILVKIK